MLVLLSEDDGEREGRNCGKKGMLKGLWKNGCGEGNDVTKELKTNNCDFCRRRKDAVTTAPVTKRYI